MDSRRTKVLIVGYGRAGKRHARLADEFGLDVTACDPNVSDSIVRFRSLQDALKAERWELAVIATPPVLHLEQVKLCLDAGLRVLCEKPLCALGQLEEARSLPDDGQVMVAYNYRWHPALVERRFEKDETDERADWSLIAIQHRIVPEWGLLLDHVSHDVQILQMMAGKLEVISAERWEMLTSDRWHIEGKVGDETFRVFDGVSKWSVGRLAKLHGPDGCLDIYPSHQMYRDMWSVFLKGGWQGSVAEAIAIQKVLEEVNCVQS